MSKFNFEGILVLVFVAFFALLSLLFAILMIIDIINYTYEYDALLYIIGMVGSAAISYMWIKIGRE